jgi:hypothetical protein
VTPTLSRTGEQRTSRTLQLRTGEDLQQGTLELPVWGGLLERHVHTRRRPAVRRPAGPGTHSTHVLGWAHATHATHATHAAHAAHATHVLVCTHALRRSAHTHAASSPSPSPSASSSSAAAWWPSEFVFACEQHCQRQPLAPCAHQTHTAGKTKQTQMSLC